MTAPISRPTESMHLGWLGWLPAGGYGNGLDDVAWAPILEISDQIVPELLRALADAQVPGYVAPAYPSGHRLRDRLRQPETYRLWVGTSSHGRAEQVLVNVMPRLVREAARRADRAWR